MTPCNSLSLPSGNLLYYTGPSLEIVPVQPLPAFFYFAASGWESLCQDPINQPISSTEHLPWRAFSLDIPFHEKGGDKTTELQQLADALLDGEDLIFSFIDTIEEAITFLLGIGAIAFEKVAIAGLSRGGFIALHAAARLPIFDPIVCYAPLTNLSRLLKGVPLPPPLDEKLNLMNICEKLVGKQVRFYIGNRDTRVGTAHAFDFIAALVEKSYPQYRSPPVEMLITPSIGAQGHGSTQETFCNGALFAAKKLGVYHD